MHMACTERRQRCRTSTRSSGNQHVGNLFVYTWTKQTNTQTNRRKAQDRHNNTDGCPSNDLGNAQMKLLQVKNTESPAVSGRLELWTPLQAWPGRVTSNTGGSTQCWKEMTKSGAKPWEQTSWSLSQGRKYVAMVWSLLALRHTIHCVILCWLSSMIHHNGIEHCPRLLLEIYPYYCNSWSRPVFVWVIVAHIDCSRL